MNTPTSSEHAVLETRTSMSLTVLDTVWQVLALLILGIGLLLWLLHPHAPVLSLVLSAVYGTLCVSDGIRRILRNRASLRLDGESIQLSGYCGASFRLDGLSRKDVVLVQDPMERHLNIGRLLIRKQGIYLRCVKNFSAVNAHISENLSQD